MAPLCFKLILVSLAWFAVVRGVRISLQGGGAIVVDVASSNSFRLGVRSAGQAPEQMHSPSIQNDLPKAPSTIVSWGDMHGVQTSFGALLASSSGDWAMYDAENNTVLKSAAPIVNVADGVIFFLFLV